MKNRVSLSFLLLAFLVAPVCFAAAQNDPSPQAQIFKRLLTKHQDLTGATLLTQLPTPNYLEKLPFDPTTARFFNEVAVEFKLTGRDKEIFRRLGFVSLNRDQRYSFISAYFDIYTHDLPVLVTTDSILNALHHSYDDILTELETAVFSDLMKEVLTACHDELAGRMKDKMQPLTMESARDVDLYLTVALNLLAGAGAEMGWDGNLKVPSRLAQESQTLTLLNKIRALAMADPEKPLPLYGGQRVLDFSQFRPRGHYTRGGFSRKRILENYFRTLMWLGRADCGWNALPATHSGSVTGSDPDRELRDAVLLTELLSKTGGLERLHAMNQVLEFLVGTSDNLAPVALSDLMKGEGVGGVADLNDPAILGRLRAAVAGSGLAAQKIRSQFVASNINDDIKVPPPAVFQLFGQRFLLDSFLLSQVVFDSIIFKKAKVPRMMPSGLDVAAVLGNDEALRMLEKELQTYPYAGNLAAGRDYVNNQAPAFWTENLYQVWLDALRTLDDRPASPNVPKIMQTGAWQKKQLQTQLASWAELRRDTILYGKQSYSGYPTCEYPKGYVEPYPELYARVAFFAHEAQRRIGMTDWPSLSPKRAPDLISIRDRQTAFFTAMAAILEKLEVLASKELAAQPFTPEEQDWLKRTVDKRGGGSGPPRYDGWYADLLYARQIDPAKVAAWDPVIADVHTDPVGKQVLEVGTGDTQFLLAAIDNEKDLSVYAGPIYSYYEFSSPERLTDEKWQGMFPVSSDLRPAWSGEFQVVSLGPALYRAISKGDIAGVRTLIAQGVKVNELISSERRSQCLPLFHAISERNKDLAQILVEAGADINRRDLEDWSPLMKAVDSRNQPQPTSLELVDYLLEQGADPLYGGWHGTVLHSAAANRDLTLVRLFISKGVDVNARDAQGLTALHMSLSDRFFGPNILGDPFEVIKALVDAGADVNARDKSDQTPLLKALTRQKYTPAEKEELPQIVGYLLDHRADIPTQALHLAARNNVGVLKLLIARGATVNVREAPSGYTPLHNALLGYELTNNSNGIAIIENNRLERVQVLLKAGADVNVKNSNGSTPLHLAADNWGQEDLIRILVKAGADVNARNSGGSTPLHLAVDREANESAIRAFVEAGADVNAVDSEGQTPIFLAFKKTYWGVVPREGNRKIVDYLLQRGADPFSPNLRKPLLHLAAECNNPAALEFLLARGAEVNIRDAKGWTPLHHARSVDNIQTLLKAGADVNARDHEGKTPLLRALIIFSQFNQNTCMQQKDVLQAFLDAAADPNLADSFGNTPLSWVKNNRPKETALVQMLETASKTRP